MTQQETWEHWMGAQSPRDYLIDIAQERGCPIARLSDGDIEDAILCYVITMGDDADDDAQITAASVIVHMVCAVLMRCRTARWPSISATAA